jgi:uracil-DNA glycosylase
MDRKELLSGISDEWLEILCNDKLDDIIENISTKNITPPVNKIFEFARLTPLDNIKIVIIGQDPYPGRGDAHGLAFSSLNKTIPASLRNIYKALIKYRLIDAEDFRDIKTADLTCWAKQGVLLINTFLSNVVGRTKAHAKYWGDYIHGVIDKVSRIENKEGMYPIFILLGNHAKEKKPLIYEKCNVLCFFHPTAMGLDFSNCKCFYEANKILRRNRCQPIKWDPRKTELEEMFNDTDMVMFTDGSCYPNNTSEKSVAGYAACVALGPHKDVILYGNIDNTKYYATNNRAEGIAIMRCFEFAKSHINDWKKLVIISDSEFWINMFSEYLPTWETTGVDFSSKKNSDITIPMWNLYSKLIKKRHVEFRHVKSHNKDKWLDHPPNSYKYFCANNNKYVDEMANYARVSVPINTDIIEDVEYS